MNADSPLVSIVLVNYNGKAFLEKCLASLAIQTYSPVEIILVDNGSTDGSLQIARDRYPAVKLIENGENLGFCLANNLGIRASRGELVITLNNDTEAKPEWVEELVKAILARPDVGMCSSKMLSMTEPGVFDSTGICVARSGACWDRGQYEQDQGQYDRVEEVFGPCAGAALYRRKMLDQIGLFDADFFAYMEDVDLAFRGQLAGWKCLFVPKAVVFHYRGGTGGGRQSEFPVYYGNRNIVWCAFKNFPLPKLLTSLPWILCRNLAVVPFYATRGFGLTALRSKVDAVAGLPATLKKRRKWPDGKRVSGMIQTWAKFPRPREFPTR